MAYCTYQCQTHSWGHSWFYRQSLLWICYFFAPYHDERKSFPKRNPAMRTGGNVSGLTVNSYGNRRTFTDSASVTQSSEWWHRHFLHCDMLPTAPLQMKWFTWSHHKTKGLNLPANIRLQGPASNWSHVHWHQSWCWQPVWIIISRCKITYIIDVTE